MYLPRAVYLDNAATTAVAPEVIEAMLPFFRCAYGNPSSRHALGAQARRAVEHARASVAAALGCQPDELLFTSGGTEANNLALLGTVAGLGRRAPHVITTVVEHPSVLRAAEALERAGVSVSRVGVDAQCRVAPERVLAAVRPQTVLVSVMLVNNEVGAIQPIAHLAGLLRHRGVLLHTDAVQALGKLPLDVHSLGVDLLSVSAHKIHGPKGAGALFVRRGVRLQPRQFGGGQERALRPGTENVPAIVGFGKAAELLRDRLPQIQCRLSALRQRFEDHLLECVGGACIHGRHTPRVCSISNVSFAGARSEWLLERLDALGICASAGSACASAKRASSHVLCAMGVRPDLAQAALRFSLSRETTDEDIAYALACLARILPAAAAKHLATRCNSAFPVARETPAGAARLRVYRGNPAG